MYTPPEIAHQDSEAQIVAELVQRMVEWSEITSRARVVKWLLHVSSMARTNQPALWMYLKLQTGDLSRVRESYTDQAQRQGVTKQAVHKLQCKTLDDLEQDKPILAKAIQSLVSHREELPQVDLGSDRDGVA